MHMKKRVLQVAFSDLGHGGIQAVIMDIVKSLSDDVQFDALVFSSKPAFYDEEFSKYGRIFKIPYYEGNSRIIRKIDQYMRYPRIKRQIYRLLKENGPYDAVHSHAFFDCAPVLSAAKKAGVPVRIAHSHNTSMKDECFILQRIISALHHSICRVIIRKNATDMVGCSRAAADYLFGKGRGTVIYNGVDASAFDISRFERYEHSGINLLNVGNFLPQKNQLFLVDIVKSLYDIRQDIHVTMIGRDTDYKSKVLDKIKDLKLNDVITVLPHNADIPFEMSKADFFVFPSNFEGFPLAMLEAQAAGLYCFVSTAVTDEVDCGNCTFLDLSAGADVWARAINDHFEKNGAEKAPVDMKRFSKVQLAEGFMKLYKRGANYESV